MYTVTSRIFSGPGRVGDYFPCGLGESLRVACGHFSGGFMDRWQIAF